MYRLNTSELSSLQIDVLLSALDLYVEASKRSVEFCKSNDLPDLKRMWQARLFAARDMRKGV